MPADVFVGAERVVPGAGVSGLEDRAAAVARLLGEVAAIAGQLGDGEAVARVRAEAAAVDSHAARVVVVGEKKRGKSSLINALLRRPALLPVDADIATSVHVTIHAAERERALAIGEDNPKGREIPLAAIGEYAALDPDTGELRPAGRHVREVSVGLPDPLLESGLVVIDTPGVGGLVSGHAALTLAALSLADALLFVVNGSSELTASECKFLAQATERVATVLFVLTQIDKHERAWSAVLARNQALILEHAPRFAGASWFAVSSAWRLDALAGGERAAELELRSGFGPLVEALSGQIAGRAAQLRAVNAAWVARRVLDRLTAGQQQQRHSLAKDPRLLAAIAEQQQQLNDCVRRDAVWSHSLDKQFGKLSGELSRSFVAKAGELQVVADQWVAEADTATVTQITHDMNAAVQALWAELESAARQGAIVILGEITAELEDGGIDLLTLDLPYPEQLQQLPEWRDTPDKKPEGVGLLARYFPGMGMASMVGHALFAAVNPFLLLPIGAVLGHFVNKDREAQERRFRVRADAERYVRHVLTYVSTNVPNAIQDGLEILHTTIKDAITERMKARIGELEAAHAESQRNLQASEQELAPKREATDKALQQLRGLADVAAQLTSTGG